MPPRTTHRACLLAALALSAVGCGGSADTARLGDYLDEFEFDAPLTSVANVSLGKFDVPVAIQPQTKAVTKSRGVWLRLSFDLFAEAAPENEKDVQAAAERHRGALNDALLTIIRTSSADELTDPRVAALKLRMTEAARPLLGARQVRQLVLVNLRSQPM